MEACLWRKLHVSIDDVSINYVSALLTLIVLNSKISENMLICVSWLIMKCAELFVTAQNSTHPSLL